MRPKSIGIMVLPCKVVGVPRLAIAPNVIAYERNLLCYPDYWAIGPSVTQSAQVVS